MILGTLGGFLGPVGGIAGSLVGGILDQYIFGLLQSPTEGPRLDEMRVPTFDEGAPAPWVQGATVRVPCQIMWISKMREQKVTSGGKGGGGGTKTVAYEYYVDVAIAFARQTLTPVKPMKMLWANGQLIYQADKVTSKTSSAVSATKNTVSKTFNTYCLNKPNEEQIVYEHQSDGEFFKDFRDGMNVVVTGFASGNNNGTFAVIKIELKTGGGSKCKMTVLRCNHAWTGGARPAGCTDGSGCTAGVTAAAGASVTFQQTWDEFDKGLVESVTHYRGTTSQTPDSLMEAAEGTGKVPAYRGTAYAVLKNLKITRWGGTIPAFEALLEEKSTRTVGEALVNILTRNGALVADDVDVTAVSGSLLGLGMLGPKAPKSIIQTLMVVYDLEVQDRAVIEGGVFKNRLTFFHKPNAQLRTIADGDRGARAPDSDPDGKDVIRVEQIDPNQLPGDVVVSFVDPDRDYQPGSRSFRRATSHTETQSQVSLPMTLSSSNALALAKKILWAMYTNDRLRIVTTLPPTYINLAEADMVDVPDLDGLILRARVTKVDRGSNGLIQIEALQEVVSVYSEPATGEDPPG